MQYVFQYNTKYTGYTQQCVLAKGPGTTQAVDKGPPGQRAAEVYSVPAICSTWNTCNSNRAPDPHARMSYLVSVGSVLAERLRSSNTKVKLGSGAVFAIFGGMHIF